MKIAIIHDFLREYGGAERVVETMHELWPDAPVYTAFVDWQSLGEHAGRFKDWDIRTSWVQHNWLVKKFHSPLRFLAPRIWESFDLSGYDVVISSSGWYICRGVKAGKRFPESAAGATRFRESPLHICYIHHPPRNLYGYATGGLYQKYWLVRAYATVINFFMRQYDFQTAQKVDYFVANSEETARRVQKFYRRDSTVIYPPVEVKASKGSKVTKGSKEKRSDTSDVFDTLTPLTQSYYLSVGRLMWAKRVDLVITAANKLKIPLTIVGRGPEEEYLRSIAGPTVEFLGGISDDELIRLYTGARATIFAALDEDFGIVPVESQAAGTPVIALAQGGVLETVEDGKTGVFFAKPDVRSLVGAIKKFEKMKKDWTKDCIAQAQKFSKERFSRELRQFVEATKPI